MNKGSAVAALIGALLASGCQSAGAQDPGPDTSRSFEVGAFDRIEVSGPYEVQVRTGGNPSVMASGPQGLIDRTLVEVQDGKLLIRPRSEKGGFRWGGNGKVEVAVTVPQLSGASIAGSGDIRVDRVRGESFDGGIKGSGGLSLDLLDVQSLSLAVGGSGDVRAANGKARTIALNIAGSGDIDTTGVEAETASANIAGSGNIAARARGTAAVNIMGSGNVEISGGAKCTVRNAGSGTFRCS